MSSCADLAAAASGGVAPALRAVDCMSGQASGGAFDRLFGLHGALMPALTALLTIYIALFGLGLLAGRTRLGLGGLMPRMLGLGLVLAFATSWAAYQSVAWSLATGAPDEIAGLALGTSGAGKVSATQLFASRIDTLFAAIEEINAANDQQAQPAPTDPANPAPAAAAKPPVAAATLSPGGLMWLGAVVLLLGTVGVLVTARIVLALLLALGPVFVVLALFPATRGLTAGWLRATVLAALAPLFAVVGGAFTLELAVPVVSRLAGPDGIDARGAMAFFLIAAVHAALMVMALRTAGTIVGAWHVFGQAGRGGSGGAVAPGSAMPMGAPGLLATTLPWQAASRYSRGSGAPAASEPTTTGTPVNLASSSRAAALAPRSDSGEARQRAVSDRRAAGIGSRFRSPPRARRLT